MKRGGSLSRSTPLERRTRLTANPDNVRAFERRGRENSKPKLRAISPASDPQREKVRDRVCVYCGERPCDPAHLVPRSLGGCDHVDCVISLCRIHHDAFDRGALDIEAVLALPDFRDERAHMAGHWSFARCIERLRGNVPHE